MFLILDDEEKIALFDDWLQPMIKRPPLIIIALLDLYRTKRWLEVNASKPPILDRPVYFMLGLWDTYIALHNIVVAAESMGLGACYYGSIMEFDVQKAALQSLLVDRFFDKLDVVSEGAGADVVLLRHKPSGRDACHARVSELEEGARFVVRRLLDEQEAAGAAGPAGAAGDPDTGGRVPEGRVEEAVELLRGQCRRRTEFRATPVPTGTGFAPPAGYFEYQVGGAAG